MTPLSPEEEKKKKQNVFNVYILQQACDATFTQKTHWQNSVCMCVCVCARASTACTVLVSGIQELPLLQHKSTYSNNTNKIQEWWTEKTEDNTHQTSIKSITLYNIMWH